MSIREIKMKITFVEALVLLFIALKLTHQIDWSWGQVLSPFAALAVIAFFSGISSAAKKSEK